jgi:RHS repeat-associated protein
MRVVLNRALSVGYLVTMLVLLSPAQASADCGEPTLQNGSSPLNGNCGQAAPLAGVLALALAALGGVGASLAVSLASGAGQAMRSGLTLAGTLQQSTVQAQRSNPVRPVNSSATSTRRAQRPTAGDPVDVATGEVFLGQTDVELAGVLPLVLSRTHVSSYRAGTVFGPSWASTLGQRLEFDAHGVVFVAEDGMLLVYPPPGAGPVLPEHGPRWPLARTSTGFALEQAESSRMLRFVSGTGAVLHLTAIEDRNGNVIEFDRNAAGTPVAIRHSGGYHLDVDTDRGLVTRLRLRGCAVIPLIRYGYDEAGRLTEVINSSGRPLTFTYDPEGRMTQWTDRNGEQYRYHYGEGGRCERTEGSGGFLDSVLSYDDGLTRYTDALGHITIYRLDRYRVVAETDPLGHTTTREWTRHGDLVATTDPLGRATRAGYDGAARVTALQRPDGGVVRIGYDPCGKPASVTAPDGTVWRNTYDSRGNLLSSTDPTGATTGYRHNERGHLTGVRNAVGEELVIENDAAGLPVAITDPAGAVTRYIRDEFGRPVAVVDPLGETWRLMWTVEGKLLSVTQPDGSTERWRYDGEGNEVEYRDPAGRPIRIDYTHFDLPAAETGPDGARTEFSYDRALRLTTVTDPQGLTWTHEYDAAGRLVSETDFNGRILRYIYDAAGQLVEHVNGAGEIIRFVHDVLGNVVERRTAEGRTVFEYDLLGRLRRAASADAEVLVQVDPLGRVTGETVNGRSVWSRYDLLGRRVARRTPAGVESTWTYGPDGRPAALRLSGRTMQFAHDALGREVGLRWDSGFTVRRAWDAASRLTEETAGAGMRRRYSRGADGSLVAIDESSGDRRRFTLDAAGRVSAVERAEGQERYGYDTSGNVLTATWPGPEGGVQGTRHYNGTMIRRAGDLEYEHDAQGRLVRRARASSDEIWLYRWNSDDELVEVTTSGGDRWRYTYDPLGRRIAKQRLDARGTVAERIDFVWDGSVVTELAHSSGAVTTWEYAAEGPDPLVQVERPPAGPMRWYWVRTDPLGTPAELVTPEGAVAWRSASSLWGEEYEAGTAASTPLRFPGQYHDPETGLHYNLFRYYDPAIGRFLTPDPLGLAGSANPHAYVGNPTAQFDLLGLTPQPGGCGQSGPPAPRSSRFRQALGRGRRAARSVKDKLPELRVRAQAAGHGADEASEQGEFAGDVASKLAEAAQTVSTHLPGHAGAIAQVAAPVVSFLAGSGDQVGKWIAAGVGYMRGFLHPEDGD